MRAMVSTPAAWRLPDAPLRLGAQIEAAFALWLRSARPALPFSLLYTLAGLLPALGLHEVAGRLLRVSANIVASAFDPSVPEPREDPLALSQATWAAMTSPAMGGLVLLSLGLGLFALAGVMLRQQAVAEGTGRGFAQTAVLALRRWPAALLASAAYTVVLLLLALPVLLPAWPLMYFADAFGMSGLLLLVLACLVASLLLSIPLVWASVAFGFAPVLAVLRGDGPVRAHRRSARLVRGHWPAAATMMTVPLLVYLGVGSTVSSAVYVAIGLSVAAVAGLDGLLQGGWIAWGQLVAALPMAFCLPLASSGFLVSLHELEIRG